MSATEIILIFLIYLILFGAKGIPSLAKTMGKAIYQFRSARDDIQREIMSSAKEITDSAKDVRNEVEKAAQLAEKQAKKAQDTLNKSLEDKKEEKPKTPPAAPPAMNPLTPPNSVTSTGASASDLAQGEARKGDENTPKT